MPRIFKHLEAGCLQVNLMSTSAQINQLKYTILYYTKLKIERKIISRTAGRCLNKLTGRRVSELNTTELRADAAV